MRKNLKSIMLLAIGLFSVFIASAIENTYTKAYIVKPGDNGDRTITPTAKKGDLLKISFSPTPGYRFHDKTKCANAGKLGWIRTGDHSFKLTVPVTVDPKSSHKTTFDGDLTKDAEGTGKGKPKLEPWNLDGLFKVLADHEGVGHDMGRDPVGKLRTDKPGDGDPFIEEGMATYDKVNDTFIGSFNIDGELYTGKYASVPARYAANTGNAEPVDGPQKNCPDCGKDHVVFAYFGCNDDEGIGGKAAPDKVYVNDFTVEPELGNTKALVEKLEAEVAELKKALVMAKSIRDHLKVFVGAKKKELEDHIKRQIAKIVWMAQRVVDRKTVLLNNAQKDLAKVQPALDTAKAKLKAAEEALEELLKESSAKLQRLVKQLLKLQKQLAAKKEELKNATSVSERNAIRAAIKKLKVDIREKETLIKSVRYSKKVQRAIKKVEKAQKNVVSAQKKVDAAQEKVDKAQAALDKARAALADAEAKAAERVERLQKTKRLRKELKALENELLKAEEAVSEAEGNLSSAHKKLVDPRKKIQELEALLDRYFDSIPGLVAHEFEHRAICYYFADKLTDMLNTLRAWGYAPDKDNAERLGKSHHRQVWREKVTTIQKEDIAMQKKFDELTHHNEFPERWKREDHLK